MPMMTLHQPYAASEYLEWMLELRTSAVAQAKLGPAEGTLLETIDTTFNHIAELKAALSKGLFEADSTEVRNEPSGAGAVAYTTVNGEDKWGRGIRMLFEDSIFTKVSGNAALYVHVRAAVREIRMDF